MTESQDVLRNPRKNYEAVYSKNLKFLEDNKIFSAYHSKLIRYIKVNPEDLEKVDGLGVCEVTFKNREKLRRIKLNTRIEHKIELQPGVLCFILGTGLGEVLRVTSGDESDIWAFECNPKIFKYSMYWFDWADWIGTGKKRKLFLLDDNSAVFHAFRDLTKSDPSFLFRKINCMMGDSYIAHLDLYGMIASLLETLKRNDKRFHAEMVAKYSEINACSKARFKGGKKRVLFLFPQFIMKSMMDEARTYPDFEVDVLDFPQEKAGEYPEALVKKLDEFKPDFCLGRNRRAFDFGIHPAREEGEFILWKTGVPYASWYTENPLKCGTDYSIDPVFEGKKISDYYSVFCFSKVHTRLMLERGFDAHYLPMGVSLGYWKPMTLDDDQVKKYGGDVNWAGRTKVDFRMPIPEAETTKAYKQMLAFALANWNVEQCYETDKDAINKALDVFDAVSKMEYLDYKVYKTALDTLTVELAHLPQDFCWHILTRLTYATSAYYMQSVVRSLIEFKPKIFGGSEWKWLFGEYQPDYPVLDYLKDMPLFYNATKVNVNVTKWELDDAIHERILDATACRAFILTDYREPVDELFPGEKPEYYNSLKELKEKIKFYLNNETARTEKINKLYDGVIKNHTMGSRLCTIYDVMKEKYGF